MYNDGHIRPLFNTTIMNKNNTTKLQQIIEKHWYKNNNVYLSVILLPLSIIFFAISKIRRLLYKLNILKSYKLPVPVIVIGNISVGGVGKTPLTQYIATELIKQGIYVGIILRGYKSSSKNPSIVTKDSDSLTVGDEALIYAQHDIPVAIGKNRYLAGSCLLKKYPQTQIILTDDGLQHYRLKRNYEIIVIDNSRMFGNKFILPMGPLRECISRLKTVNAIAINGSNVNLEKFAIDYGLDKNILTVTQQLYLVDIYNPITKNKVDNLYFSSKQVIAMAAMGNPERFFNFIESLGINPEKKISFPDHHHYTKNDIPDNFTDILVTEKDYTKLTKLNNDKIWIVRVKVKLSSEDLIKQILDKV